MTDAVTRLRRYAGVAASDVRAKFLADVADELEQLGAENKVLKTENRKLRPRDLVSRVLLRRKNAELAAENGRLRRVAAAAIRERDDAVAVFDAAVRVISKYRPEGGHE